jgi:transcription initiation factor TFIIE subunit alpha
VYDQYYASLAASSAQATPTGTGVPSSSNSPDFLNSHLYDDEEEDKKPNVEYLDSLNAYRKRSRSQEDVGSADKIKVAKIGSSVEVRTANGHANGFLGVNGLGHYGNGNKFSAEFQNEVMQPQQELDEWLTIPEDDPMILGESSSSYFLFCRFYY